MSKIRHIRHIPDENQPTRTYCGRDTERAGVICIDRLRECIDDAECKSCQRSDDRRTREAYTTESEKSS